MEEKKFVQLKKDEYGIREFVKKELGKGKISSVKIEYTPIGEKIVIATNKPGFVIGRKGEKINELVEILRKRFSLENPHIEIAEIDRPEFDAQSVADEIAMSLERFGSLKFKIVAYKALDRIVRAGALGVEIRLSGKLPSERAKSWRFAQGYLKKTGDTAKIVNKAEARAETLPGTIGVKVSILPPGVHIHDKIEVSPELIARLKSNNSDLGINEKAEEDMKSEKKSKRKKKTEETVIEEMKQ